MTPKVVSHSCVVSHGKFIGEVPLETALELSINDRNSLVVGGKEVRFSRLRCFSVHGTKCVRCDRKGTRVLVTIDNGGAVHADLYCKSKNKKMNNLILMNRDHILPRAKGGKDSLWNYQTMCQPCNTKKGAEATDEDMRLIKFRKKWSKWFNFLRPITRNHPLTYKVAKMLAKIT